MFFIWSMFTTWLGIGVEYIIAAVMIAGGAYLAILFDLAATNPLYWLLRPLRWIGIALVLGGVVLGSFTYGKTVGTISGARACQEEWKRKNYEAQIARLKQEADANKAAAEKAAQEAQQLASEKDAQDKQLSDYQEIAAKLPACRHATLDDDLRMCGITGNSPVGCKSPANK